MIGMMEVPLCRPVAVMDYSPLVGVDRSSLPFVSGRWKLGGRIYGVLVLNSDYIPVVKMVSTMEPEPEIALVASCGWR